MELDKNEYLKDVFLDKKNIPLLIDQTEGRKVNLQFNDITINIPKANGLTFRQPIFYKPLELYAFLDETE